MRRDKTDPGPAAEVALWPGSWRPLAGLLAVAALLLAAWSVAVPIFESPDEIAHWQYARYLHDHRRLPVYGPDFVEANSPPLYYALIAAVAFPSDVPPLLAWHEPGAGPGAVRRVLPAPPRLFENAAGDLGRYGPLRAARLLTAAMSVVTVLCCALAGAEATGQARIGLLTGGLVAFLPQFAFRGSNISNDALVTTLSAIVLYLTVRIVRRGFSWRLGALAAAAIAGAFLAKTNAIFLPAPLALAILSERAPWRERAGRLGVLGVGAVLAVPWLARNVAMYGDPLAEAEMRNAVGFLIAEKSLTDPFFRDVFFQRLIPSTVGGFGWLTLYLPRWAFLLVYGVAAAAALGVAWRARRRPERRLLAILVSFPILALGVVVYINLSFDQPQGRYLFPALPAAGLLAALGLDALPGWRPRAGAATFATLGAALALNLYALLGVVVPAFWPAVTDATSRAALDLTVAGADRTAASGDGGLMVAAGAPPVALAAPGAIEAARYSFVELFLTGVGPRPVVEGALYFTPAGGAEVRVPFRWAADGRRQRVVVPLRGEPAWRGPILSLRLAPFRDGAANAGATTTVGPIALLGSLAVPRY